MADLSLTLSPQTPADLAAIEKLDERAFGPGRFRATSIFLPRSEPKRSTSDD
jgi:predicted N-acetyltransferase YhbS